MSNRTALYAIAFMMLSVIKYRNFISKKYNAEIIGRVTDGGPTHSGAAKVMDFHL